LAMVGFAQGASAHHANISGSTACGNVVSWTASSWSNDDGAGDNGYVNVEYQVDGSGPFVLAPSGGGSFDAPAKTSFSGSFTLDGDPTSVTLRVTAAGRWGNGAAGGQQQSQTLTFPTDCTPPP